MASQLAREAGAYVIGTGRAVRPKSGVKFALFVQFGRKSGICA
jgi:hypothetical protein